MKTVDLGTGTARVRVPAETGFAEHDERVAKLEEQREAARSEKDREKTTLAELDQAHAEQTDRQARALIDGGSEPKAPPKIAALEKKLAGIREALAVREQAVRILEQEIAGLIDSSAPAWASSLEEETAAKLAAWREEIDGLEERAVTIASLVARRRWATTIARGEKAKAVDERLVVHDLIGRNGSGYRLSDVLAALRRLGEPPKQKGLVKLRSQTAVEQEARLREAEDRFEESVAAGRATRAPNGLPAA